MVSGGRCSCCHRYRCHRCCFLRTVHVTATTTIMVAAGSAAAAHVAVAAAVVAAAPGDRGAMPRDLLLRRQLSRRHRASCSASERGEIELPRPFPFTFIFLFPPSIFSDDRERLLWFLFDLSLCVLPLSRCFSLPQYSRTFPNCFLSRCLFRLPLFAPFVSFTSFTNSSLAPPSVLPSFLFPFVSAYSFSRFI